ncbi:MAG: hypothetical protein U1F43_07730 [Myxococcota bacterium]
MRAAPLDWARVEDEVARRGVAADAATALELLGDYAAPIPADVAPRLRRLPERRVDRWRQAHTHGPWDRPKPPAVIAFDAWRFVEGQPLARALPVLGRYAWLRMAPDGKLASVPRQLFEKIIRPRL